jgi:hypothetical protein
MSAQMSWLKVEACGEAFRKPNGADCCRVGSAGRYGSHSSAEIAVQMQSVDLVVSGLGEHEMKRQSSQISKRVRPKRSGHLTALSVTEIGAACVILRASSGFISSILPS